MRFKLLLIMCTMIFIAGNAAADGIPVKPGKWEMTSTMTMTMMPQPQTNTVTECIKTDHIDPESFNMDEENPCSIEDVSIDGDTLAWSIVCPTPAGQMDGQWEMTSNGDSLSGRGTMSAEISGQKMGFDMTWSGKRIGDCD
ncbi:MAG: DUF3617 domain-containing protein [Gammaproteobacteria bacterium]|nr:DUF3617 domain-containing protein [Gammaproteobacteria bacterium]